MYAADASLVCFFGAPEADVLARDDDEAGGTTGTPRHVLIFTHAGSLPRTFHVPKATSIASLTWRILVATGKSPPDDIFPDGSGPVVDVKSPIELPPRSLVCMIAEAGPALTGTQPPVLPRRS